MKELFEKMEQYMAAAAFAEAGEFETAKEMLTTQKRVQPRTRPRPRTEVQRPRPEMRASSLDE